MDQVVILLCFILNCIFFLTIKTPGVFELFLIIILRCSNFSCAWKMTKLTKSFFFTFDFILKHTSYHFTGIDLIKSQ